jgi:hypothetical protein
LDEAEDQAAVAAVVEMDLDLVAAADPDPVGRER